MSDLSRTLEISDVEALYANCREMIEKEIFKDPSPREAARLDGSAILDPLAWRILIPVLVSITGGVITHTIKDKIAAKKSRAEAESEARSFAGKHTKRIEAEELQECVTTVETIVLPFGIRKERAEVIVRKLTQSRTDQSAASS